MEEYAPDSKMVASIMRKCIPQLALACALLLTLSVVRADGTREQIDEAYSGGNSLFQQKLQVLATQKKLADEGKALNAQGTELNQEQAGLNQQTDQHNQQVADQKAQIDKTREGCGNSGDKDSSPQETDACNKSAKSLNQKSAAINADLQSLQAKQGDLAARFARYQQAVTDWNQRNQATVAALNRVNKRLDNWLNFSYNFMAGADFQAAVAASGSTDTCGEGTKRIEASAAAPLDDSARFILACLKTVKKQLPKPAG